MLYRALIRPLLFRLSPETAHRLVLWVMSRLGSIPGGTALLAWMVGRPHPALKVWVLGRELSSPLGLAAGLDKDAEAFAAFGALGFGHVEVGTLTARAQPGNPRPRLFRLPVDRALINRMGFNNAGAADAAGRLARQRPRGGVPGLLGVNIGKSKQTPQEQAVTDYVQSATRLAPHADYMVVNVSSPNTPGLRELQSTQQLRPLLLAVQQAADAASGTGRRVPLLVKIAPDLPDADIDAITDLALELDLAGIVAVNTTSARAGLRTPPAVVARCGEGGLSGPPLRERALEVLRRIRRRAGDGLLLISVGGVTSAEDVWARWQAGASLIQLYTALIYEGPGLVERLHRDLVRRIELGGFASLSEARGQSQ